MPIIKKRNKDLSNPSDVLNSSPSLNFSGRSNGDTSRVNDNSRTNYVERLNSNLTTSFSNARNEYQYQSPLVFTPQREIIDPVKYSSCMGRESVMSAISAQKGTSINACKDFAQGKPPQKIVINAMKNAAMGSVRDINKNHNICVKESIRYVPKKP